jgi:hypothetical protein
MNMAKTQSRSAALAALSTCLLLAALPSSAAVNQTVNGVTWAFTYDGDVVPTQSSPAWSVASGGSGTATAVSDGALLALKSGIGSANALSYQVGATAGWNAQLGAGDSTVETRFRLNSWDTGGATGTVAQSIRIATGLRDIQLRIRPCEVSFAGGTGFAIDTTQFHTYRIVVTGGVNAALYVDGNPVPVLTRQETVVTTANALRFGDITATGAGEVVWDHLRWTNQGAFAPASVDAFGTRLLYPTQDGGREWRATWNNGIARVLASGDRDPHDAEFIVRGSGTIGIDGQGVAIMSGSSPRMYVYDAPKIKKWNNVEVTFYAMRVSETDLKSYQGFVAGTRSDHQDQSGANPNPCAHNYYGRMLYDGRMDFEKEFVHPDYGEARGEIDVGPMQALAWIGYKFVVRTVEPNKVHLALYRDLTDGQNGGSWTLMTDYTDVPGLWDAVTACAGGVSTDVITLPGTSTFVRNDSIGEARYKKFSIREIHTGG